MRKQGGRRPGRVILGCNPSRTSSIEVWRRGKEDIFYGEHSDGFRNCQSLCHATVVFRS